jgi:hypothetical protein
MGHTGTMIQYLGSFLLYTLLAIGIIYLAYWYTAGRRNTSNPVQTENEADNTDLPRLEIESVLNLELNKNLYVIRNGDERFLVSTSDDETSCLSRLEPVTALQTLPPPQYEHYDNPENRISDTGSSHSEKPWYHNTVSLPPIERKLPQKLSTGGFTKQLLHSIQWLIRSRMSNKR